MERLPIHKICDYCEWYDQRGDTDRAGYCRRYPFEIERFHDDWCGEYQFDPNKIDKPSPT